MLEQPEEPLKGVVFVRPDTNKAWMEELTGKGKPQIEGVEPLYKGEIGFLNDGFLFVKDLKGSSNA